VAGIVAARGFAIDNSVGVWFARDDPALGDYRAFLREFGHREWLLVALEWAVADAEVDDARRAGVAAALERIEHVHRAVSAAGLAHDSELVRRFLRPERRGAIEALLLQVTNDIDTPEGYREDLVARIREVAEALPDVSRVRIAGTAVINGELNRSARRDMVVFLPVVALFLTVLGALTFRNWRDTAVLLAIAFGTVIVTQGTLIGVGYPLNMITIMLPTVLIALSVADAVHLIHVFHGLRSEGSDSTAAAKRAVAAIWLPCAGTSLTTIAGFLSFSRSSVLPIFQLALFASLGIALAWALTMTAGPMLLAELWREGTRAERPSTGRTDRLMVRWSRLVDTHPVRIVSAFALSSLVLVGLATLKADTDYVAFFRSDTRVPRDYRDLQAAGFPQNPLTLVFRPPPGRAPTSPEYRIPLESFARRLEALSGVHSVLSPFTMPQAPDTLGSHPEDLGGMLSRGGDQVQLVVMLDHPNSAELLELLPRIHALASATLPADLDMVATGTPLLWAGMDHGVIRTQRESLVVVSVVCLGLLALLFRSLPLAALGLALGLYPVGLVLGLMGLLGITVNMATVLIAGIAVGLAVDDTIHFVHEYQTARRNGLDPAASSERALVRVGPRMGVTSFILVGAFAVMGLSDFLPTAQFGLLSSLTIALALVTDLALLPVLLSSAPGVASAGVLRAPRRMSFAGEDHDV
jgi:hypothetical protein